MTFNRGVHTRFASAAAALLFMVLPALASAASCAPPPAGLITWLRADGNADNAAGAGSGLLENAAKYGPGIVGSAFDFDGVNADVRFPHDPAQNVGSQLTVDAWIYQRTPTHGRVIVQKRAPTLPDGVGGFSFETTHSPYGPDFGLQFILWIGGAPQFFATPANVLQLNTWQHVAATYDGATKRIYVDGVERASAPQTGSIDTSTEPLLLGRNAVYGSLVWDGLIDELDVYNRALGAAEIQAIALAGSAGKCATALPVGGAISGMSLRSGKLVCHNQTTGQSATLTLPDTGQSWDCRRAGLVIHSGDKLIQSLTVSGKAN